MKLVIVESPAKAKTINKYLGSDYKVLASFGHIRDLPSKDGSVNPDEDFAMTWELSPGGKKRLNDIIAAVKDADTIVLASDPDREGEAIAWHILEELTARKKIKDKKIERVVFHEITKSAVTEAIKNPRQIDNNLVSAYPPRFGLPCRIYSVAGSLAQTSRFQIRRPRSVCRIALDLRPRNRN